MATNSSFIQIEAESFQRNWLKILISVLVLAAELWLVASPYGGTYYRNLFKTLRTLDYPCPYCGRPSTKLPYRSSSGGTSEDWHFCLDHAPDRIENIILRGISVIPGLHFFLLTMLVGYTMFGQLQAVLILSGRVVRDPIFMGRPVLERYVDHETGRILSRQVFRYGPKKLATAAERYKNMWETSVSLGPLLLIPAFGISYWLSHP